MPERPFVCTPTEWNRDAVLNGVSWEAEFLFRRIVNETDRHWRLLVDGENIPQSIRCRAFEPRRRHDAWTLPKIARLLNELLSAGVVRRLVQGSRCWIEVADHLQYEKGKDKAAGPDVPEQAAMELGAELFPLPPPDHLRGGGAGAPFFRQTPNIPVRVEGELEKSKAPDSARARVPVDSGTRVLSRDGESARFARGPSAAPNDELWESLCRVLGMVECQQNGAMWLKRLRLCRRELANALEDYMAKTPAQRAIFKSPAQFITAAFEGEKRRQAS